MPSPLRPLLLIAALALTAAQCDKAPEVPPPGPVEVGVATHAMPAPLGIGTVGFRGFGVSGASSPFSDIYPATTQIHGLPEFKVVVVSRGPGHELVFVRLDTVGIFQQLRESVLDELEARLGRDLDDALIMGANHTHSGPGRVIDGGGPFDLIADTFFPEFYRRMVDTIADTVEAAYADLAPGRLGRAEALVPDAHEDRRCEDGMTYQNDRLPILAVEQEGTLTALVMAYASHGTKLNMDDHTLSQDVYGASEQAVEDRFDHPVEVALFNSWGADMRPAAPPYDASLLPELPRAYEEMERTGAAIADEIEVAMLDVTWMDDPIIAAKTQRVAIDRDILGYEGNEFPYDYGGVFCGSAREVDCDGDTLEEGLDHACIAFPEEYPAPMQTVFSAGQIGDLHFVTFPGEAGTALAEEVMDSMSALGGVPQTLFLGYSQDYTGYSILEHDWWNGGYVASGAMWGPRQGEYLRDHAMDAYAAYRAPLDAEAPPEPAPLAGFTTTFTPRVATQALQLGTVLSQPPALPAPHDIVEVTIAGGDPWLGTPTATLLNEDGTPATRANGMPITSADYLWWITMAPTPAYEDDRDASARTFAWTFHLPTVHATPEWPSFEGTYLIEVALPRDGAEPLRVTTAPFTVVP